jgi:hypothetical protein
MVSLLIMFRKGKWDNADIAVIPGLIVSGLFAAKEINVNNYLRVSFTLIEPVTPI